MKKFPLFTNLLLFIVTYNNCNAQLYAKNASVYVADNYVFVKGNVNLDTGGNVYLRNESQLLQGTTTTSTNTGVGKLSVFQEGAASSFGYGYWCSPVGNASAATGNEAFGIAMLNRPTTKTVSTPATFVHDWTYNGTSNPLNIERK